MNEIVKKLVSLAGKKFWGSITIKFQDGKPVVIETYQTEKL